MIESIINPPFFVLEMSQIPKNVSNENNKMEIEKPIYVVSIRTEYEKFAEEKLELEEDPFKRTKQESAVEEFQIMEEEYREKLKTHKKILKDGNNIWIPIDSLIVSEDSTIVEESKIENPEVIEVATIPPLASGIWRINISSDFFSVKKISPILNSTFDNHSLPFIK